MPSILDDDIRDEICRLQYRRALRVILYGGGPAMPEFPNAEDLRVQTRCALGRVIFRRYRLNPWEH